MKCDLCPLFVKNEKNNYIEYQNKYYYCYTHGKEFISYCNKCNNNLCFQCEEKHKNHKIIYLKQFKNNNNKIEAYKEEMKNFKEIIYNYEKQIKSMNILFTDMF